ncbi:MAG: heme o synthase [Candidatus Dadabacteria bacterium]|nr:heme o synthase [Candidatus Dadabacteria bacterium]MCY4262380.1 heme o synthase [Candidatus Dadabacteria bacterium]
MSEVQKKSVGNMAVSAVILSKPGIIMSVAFTGLAGMVVANRALPSLQTIFLCVISLLLSAGGAAILNNLLDKQIDKQMTRLNKRVEALRVLGDRNAWVTSILMMTAALLISLYYFNYVNAALILLAILSYTLIYTLFLKRTSPFGTVLGGIPGALPVLVGYTAIKPTPQLDAMIVFIFMMLWQPPHFWVLAQKYRNDYEKAGINVLPVALGTKYTNILILTYSLSLIPLTFMLWLTGINTVYFVAFAAVSGIYFNYLVVRSVFANRGYGKAFSASIIYMLLIMLGIVVDILIKSLSPVERVIGNLM